MKTSIFYMAQLDGLRAIAIFLVMVQHWLPNFLGFSHWGDLGVRCFFVLSGFLITGILLRARQEVDHGRSTAAHQFRQFYIRRALRIFPIYYLALAAAALLGMRLATRTLPWHLFYASNIYFALHGWSGYISHLWSLSVEEQFYLLWPAFILLLPSRRLPAILAAGLAMALGFRAGMASVLGAEHVALKVLLPACMDSLLVGALLAWWFSNNQITVERLAMWRRWFGLGFAVICLLYAEGRLGTFTAVTGPSIESAFFAAIIGSCAIGLNGAFGRFLLLRPVQYFGRISYGLYLYHLFVGYLFGSVCMKLGLPAPTNRFVMFALFFPVTVAGASLSWFLIERPIMALKRFFPVTGGLVAPSAAVAIEEPRTAILQNFEQPRQPVKRCI